MPVEKMVLKTIFGLLFEWPLETGFTVSLLAGSLYFDTQCGICEK